MAKDQEVKLSPEERIWELCPKSLRPDMKKAKTPAARADFLYGLEAMRLEAQKAAEALKKFQTALEDWFIEQLPAEDATGTAGKLGRVEIKRKTIPTVEDWPKFYAYVKKTGAFELMQRRLSDKAIDERWEANKEVPGVGRFIKKTVSITKVK